MGDDIIFGLCKCMIISDVNMFLITQSQCKEIELGIMVIPI